VTRLYRVVVPSLAGGAAGAACLLWLLSTASAARPSPVLPSGLPEPDRTRLQGVADRADVSTRVDAEPFVARPEVFEYLLDHPEFATHVTRTLRLARYRIWRTPEGLFLDDGWGATGHFWLIHAGPGTRVMRARGQYKKGILPSIQGEAVTMIEYGLTPMGNGKALVRTTVSGFLKLDSRIVALAMKVASVVAQRKADLEAKRLMRVFARASRAIDENPAGLLQQLRQRGDVPQQELREFTHLLRSH
jgi:hypothetical protein